MSNKTKIKKKITDLLSLRLEGNRCYIYIAGERFSQCMQLLLNIPNPEHDLDEINELNSIDELKDFLKNTEETQDSDFSITPEEEFFAHYSNLKAWVEHGYDTRLIDSRLGFPILLKLNELGHKESRPKLREEISYRIDSGYRNTQYYIVSEILPKIPDLFNFQELKILEEKLLLGEKKIYGKKDLLTIAYDDLITTKLSIYINKERKLTYNEILIKFIREEATKNMMRSLMKYHYIQKISPFLLNRNKELILEKMPPYYHEDFLNLLSRINKPNHDLEISNEILEKTFGDRTITFREIMREMMARQFNQLNGKLLHSISFIIDSSKDCSYCRKEEKWKEHKHIAKADFRITFLMGNRNWRRKFFSKYACEKCLIELVDSIINGFEKLKEEIYKII